MSMFNIWCPYVVPSHPKTIEFVLTRGEADTVAKGTKEFMEGLLQDIGVKANVKSWSIQRYRSQYYSEYLDEEDWEDKWQPIWKIHVVTTAAIDSLPEMNTPWIGTNAFDESWSADAKNREDKKVGCLVVSDFDNETLLEKAQAAILDADLKKFQDQYSIGKPKFGRSKLLGKYEQLHIDLGEFSDEFFAEGADYAEQVMKLCKKAKGTVHFEDRTS